MPGRPITRGRLPRRTIVIVGGVAALGIFWFIYRRKTAKTAEQGESTPTADQGLTSQSFVPVVGEGGGVGAAGTSLAGAENAGVLQQALEAQSEQQRESNNALLEYLRQSTTEQNSLAREAQQNFAESIRGLTGGGAPSTQAPPGAVAAPPSPSSPSTPQQTPSVPTVVKQSSQPTCPKAYPHQGPHGCYRTAKNSKGHVCHYYQNGTVECP